MFTNLFEKKTTWLGAPKFDTHYTAQSQISFCFQFLWVLIFGFFDVIEVGLSKNFLKFVQVQIYIIIYRAYDDKTDFRQHDRLNFHGQMLNLGEPLVGFFRSLNFTQHFDVLRCLAKQKVSIWCERIIQKSVCCRRNRIILSYDVKRASVYCTI